MLYQFTDKLSRSSIDVAMQLRAGFIPTRTIFVCNCSSNIYENIKQFNYNPATDRYIEHLPTDLEFTGQAYTLEMFEKTLPSCRKEVGHDAIRYYTDTHEYCCYVKDGAVFKAETKWSEGFIASYYEHTLVKQEVYEKKDLYVLKHITIHNEDGSIAYYRYPDGSFVMNQQKFPNKKEFYRYIISTIPITKDDFVTLDIVYLYIDLLFPHIEQATVILPTYGEFLLTSSLKRNKAYLKHGFKQDNPGVIQLYKTQKRNHCLFNDWYSVLTLYPDKLDLIVTETELEKLELEKHMIHYLPKKPVIACPPKWIDCVENLGRGNAVCTVVRLSKEKHPLWLIKAAVIAQKQILDLVFDIYGNGELYNELKEYLEQQQIHFIHLKGWTMDKQISRNYQVFMNASLGEGFCQAMYEAVACGCAVVATDTAYGHQTHVYQNGILVDVEEKEEEEIIQALADALVDVLKDVESYKKYSHALVAKYTKEYYDKIWQDILIHQTWKK